jgi:ribosomal protein L35
LNTHKSRNRKRRLRGGLVTDTAIAKKYVKALLGVS